VGIDIDQAYLHRARDFARRSDLWNVDLRHCALADVNERAAFDCVSMINGVFYYFPSGPAMVEAVAQVYALLKPGGLLVMEGGNLLYFLRHYGQGLQAKTIQRLRGVRVRRRIRHEIDLAASRWIHHDTYDVPEVPGINFSERFSFTIFAPLAVQEALEQAGFVDVSVHPSWQRGAGDVPCGSRLVITGHKH
jgi:SAM-dependent methyltransferase